MRWIRSCAQRRRFSWTPRLAGGSCPERVLPLGAEPSERGEVVKALRLGELAPDNRRPLFLYETPFTEATQYFVGLAEAIMHDYEALRKGVGEEGVTLPAFTMNPIGLGPLECAVLAMERAATLLGDRFEGATVALVPEQVARSPEGGGRACAGST